MLQNNNNKEKSEQNNKKTKHFPAYKEDANNPKSISLK